MKNKKEGETDPMSGPSGGNAGGMKKTLPIWNFFTIRSGAIIGTGWVLPVGDWMVIGDGPMTAIIAFTVGAMSLLPIEAASEELTAAISISGGVIEYMSRIHGRYVSYITRWSLVLGNGILCPWEAIAISTLISGMSRGLFPILKATELCTIMGTDVYLFPIVIVLGFAVYVVLLNFRGASAAAKPQVFLTKALLADTLPAMVISFVKGGPSDILPSSTQVEGPPTVTSASNIFAGIISVLIMTPFFYAGLGTVPQQAEGAAEGLDWNKFGRIINMALPAAGGSYTTRVYSSDTIIPWTDFIKSTVPALTCPENVSTFLYVAILVIATLGSMGPTNSFYGATSRIMLAVGRKGQLPDSFAVLNEKSGIPKMTNMVLTVLTIMGPFLGKNMLVSLASVSTLTFIFSCTMVSFACLKMYHMEPDLPRPCRVPGGRAGICMVRLTGTIIIGLMVTPFSPVALKSVEWVVVVAQLTIGLGLDAITRARGNNKATAAAK